MLTNALLVRNKHCLSTESRAGRPVGSNPSEVICAGSAKVHGSIWAIEPGWSADEAGCDVGDGWGAAGAGAGPPGSTVGLPAVVCVHDTTADARTTAPTQLT